MQPPPAGKEPRDFLPPTVAEAAAVYKYAQQYGGLTPGLSIVPPNLLNRCQIWKGR